MRVQVMNAALTGVGCRLTRAKPAAVCAPLVAAASSTHDGAAHTCVQHARISFRHGCQTRQTSQIVHTPVLKLAHTSDLPGTMQNQAATTYTLNTNRQVQVEASYKHQAAHQQTLQWETGS
jgi:hypothetical protein